MRQGRGRLICFFRYATLLYSLYARISGQEAQEIRDILARNKDKLPQGIREELLFGLKYVAER